MQPETQDQPPESGAAIAGSAELCRLNYDPAVTQEALFGAHLEWARRHAAPLYPPPADGFGPDDPARRLRIGYVSGDLRRHPVAFFALPFLQCHDRDGFEPVCYDTSGEDDDLNRHMRSLVPSWRDVAAEDDAALAARIREDRIDILVDLSGHTARNRLLVFARRPAPVQVTGLGYVATTGLVTMDYRLTDAWCDPPELDAERHHSETLWRLDGGFNAYLPPQGLPEPGPPAASTISTRCQAKLLKLGPKFCAPYRRLGSC